jgi:isoleucyl-tRNA synthetase
MVLKTLSQLMAPIAPFVAEEIYRNLTDNESVHLSGYPKFEELSDLHKEILSNMKLVRDIVSHGNAVRKEKQLSIRQPLSEVVVEGFSSLSREFEQIIQEELNVKAVSWKKSDTQLVTLNTELTQELKDEGEARNLIRQIQALRKKEGLQLSDHIVVSVPIWPKSFEATIKEKTLAIEIRTGDTLSIELVSPS